MRRNEANYSAAASNQPFNNSGFRNPAQRGQRKVCIYTWDRDCTHCVETDSNMECVCYPKSVWYSRLKYMMFYKNGCYAEAVKVLRKLLETCNMFTAGCKRVLNPFETCFFRVRFWNMLFMLVRNVVSVVVRSCSPTAWTRTARTSRPSTTSHSCGSCTVTSPPSINSWNALNPRFWVDTRCAPLN